MMGLQNMVYIRMKGVIEEKDRKDRFLDMVSDRGVHRFGSVRFHQKNSDRTVPHNFSK